MFQEVAVVLIVAAAVALVLRRFGVLGRRRRERASFVPLASLRQRPGRKRDGPDACH